MKRFQFLCLFFLPGLLSAQDGSDFVRTFDALKKEGNTAELETLLKTSEESEADNPDFYALASNYWWGVSQSISINTKPPEGGDFAIKNPDGTNAGSISSVGKSNPAIPQRALDLLQTGYGKFPGRLDLGFGLATIQRQLEKKADLEKTLLTIIETAKVPDALSWTENKKLPEEPDIFVPQSVHSYVKYFFDQETDEDDDRVDQLTKRLTEVFPKHPYAWNMRAALASVRKDNKGVLLNLETAHKLAPEDALILLNLADSYLKQNMPDKAAEAAGKVLKIRSASRQHAEAKKILESVEAAKK